MTIMMIMIIICRSRSSSSNNNNKNNIYNIYFPNGNLENEERKLRARETHTRSQLDVKCEICVGKSYFSTQISGGTTGFKQHMFDSCSQGIISLSCPSPVKCFGLGTKHNILGTEQRTI